MPGGSARGIFREIPVRLGVCWKASSEEEETNGLLDDWTFPPRAAHQSIRPSVRRHRRLARCKLRSMPTGVALIRVGRTTAGVSGVGVPPAVI